ncbi:hypothetical protein T492DRAFT_859030 [Pavlovales sp. CCMP2436]|nr:hypothetical protein T492DRAFT_859030 [Pavlovales sp. CCMP2436]
MAKAKAPAVRAPTARKPEPKTAAAAVLPASLTGTLTAIKLAQAIKRAQYLAYQPTKKKREPAEKQNEAAGLLLRCGAAGLLLHGGAACIFGGARGDAFLVLAAAAPPKPNAARIKNLLNGFTFAPGPPDKRDPITAAILLRDPHNFPPETEANGVGEEGLPEFACALRPGISLSHYDVVLSIVDDLVPIKAGYEFWFGLTTVDDYTTISLETDSSAVMKLKGLMMSEAAANLRALALVLARI